ncbi:hypothetical protein INT45_013549 [Circinella minor]|uniref:SWI/SNF related-matrix-associated actin-dependent regulator of chromatin subfamily C n=1 Tax=Circinella minor TaxID=1195481 RepID=A0A8H7S6E7_9FUNG|nr:hypothetical protein INT45_013549 [Circinella minor]
MAIPQEPKIDFNFYEQPSTISHFDAIVEKLRHDLESEGADTTFTAPGLAHFTAKFQQFQQDALGPSIAETARQSPAETSSSNTFPSRIPASFFRVDNTLSKTSPLYTILKAAYGFQSDKDISDWQFDIPEEKPLYLELVRHIKRSLVASNVYKIPLVAFDQQSIDASTKSELEKKIIALGGSVSSNTSTATHVVYKDGQPLKHNEKRAFRTLEKNDGKVYVHWIHLPDSYDSWINESEQQQYNDVTKEAESFTTQQQSHVSSSWINDSYKYNEWMNPLDYIVQEDNSSPKSGIKRTMEESSSFTDESNPTKKSRTPQPNDDKTATPAASGTTEPTTESMEVTETDGVNPDSVVVQQRQRDAARKYISIQTHEIVIPSYAAWFDISEIHDIERRSLPEFFNNLNRSKTPSVYKDYRDFMVNTYRLNPVEYLTVTACRRNLTGDVCAIIRVHAFLEQWGLINYQVDPDAKPSNIGPPFSGQFKIIADMPKAIINSNPATTDANEKELTSAEDDKKEDTKASVKMDSNLELRNNIYDTSQPESATTEPDNKECASCSKQCSKEQRYHKGDIYICDDCYREEKFPSNTTAEEFTQDEEQSSSASLPKEPWTEQEDLLLLEGLRMFEDDWNAVADHVSTRSRDECILHYLHLPIDDPHVDSEIAKLGLLQLGKSKTTENPIMSVVAFLASTVKPKVAAAAGQQQEEEPEKTGKTDSEQEEKEGVNKDDQKEDKEKAAAEKKREEEIEEARKATYNLIRTKMRFFETKVSQYEKLEEFVEEERRKLERERYQLNIDRLALKDQITQVQREVAKRGNSASANSITPAQIQQQIAGGMGAVSAGNQMYMNAGGQPNPMQLQHQQQQQQFQMQMQRQMQPQQGHQFQPPSGHNYNNMMSF